MKKHINRRQAIKSAGIAAGAVALGAGFPAILKSGPEKLNFLFILTDDQRYDALSAAGHPFLKTPNLDWIAHTGARFTNAFVTTSLCSPSRASFLTGCYAHNHGVLNNITPWQESNVTFLELLKQAGYYTGFIGKWHMPGKGLPDLYGQGKVDEFISFTAVAGQGIYNNCPLFKNGQPLAAPGYISEVLNDLAVQFLQAASGKNFCLYLAHKAAHAPFAPPPAFKGAYRDQALPLPPEYRERGLNFRNSYMHTASGLLTGKSMEQEMRAYYETLAAFDNSLGRVFEELDRQKILDRTVIVFAGDNGYMWGEHRMIDKRVAYEESMRIPFLVRAPGILPSAGANIAEMVLNIDLAPTFLELAGAPVPDSMQGMSLKPLLTAKPSTWRESFLYEYFYDPPYPIPANLAVRTRDKKYIRYENGKWPEELFDLQNDPREQTNLASKPEAQSQKQQLVAELKKLLKETGYPENEAREKFKLEL